MHLRCAEQQLICVQSIEQQLSLCRKYTIHLRLVVLTIEPLPSRQVKFQLATEGVSAVELIDDGELRAHFSNGIVLSSL